LTIKRAPGAASDVTVRAPAVLPPGLSVDPLTIKASESSGRLVVRAAAGTPQGPLDVTLEGTSGRQVVTTKLPLFVRGKPGSVDTTFGTNGSVTAIQLGEEPVQLLVGANDELFVVASCEEYNKSCVAKLAANGTLDANYGGGLGRLNVRLPGPATLTSNGKVIVGGAGPAALGRLTVEGKPDVTFSGNGVLDVAGRASEGTPLGTRAFAQGADGSLFIAFDTDAGYVGFRKYDSTGASGGWGISGLGYQAVKWGTQISLAGIAVRETGALVFAAGYVDGSFGVGIGQWSPSGDGLDLSIGNTLVIQSNGRIVFALKKLGGPSSTFLVRLWD
jgi:hypothetical protein